MFAYCATNAIVAIGPLNVNDDAPGIFSDNPNNVSYTDSYAIGHHTSPSAFLASSVRIGRPVAGSIGNRQSKAGWLSMNRTP